MSFVSDLNDRHFQGGLSSDVMALLAPVDDQRPEVRDFLARVFAQLQEQRTPARDFSEGLAWVIGYFLPNILPGAWGGAVPPITQRGRHAVIDEYLARNPWRPVADGDCLLDLGCGFPPMTTLDSAERFPRIRITGADPSFGKYLVRGSNGDYAAFDDAGGLLYFQAGVTDVERWDELYRDTEATRARFVAALNDLRPQLPDDDGSLSAITQDGVELVRNPVMEFSRENVTFEQFGFGAEGISGFAAVRCFNVLFYFDDTFRNEALDWLADVVVDGGIFVSGVDWSRSRYARYSVYRAEAGAMKPREFAFSIENVRPLELVSVFTLHPDDHDMRLMSRLIRVLRGDDEFRSAIDRRMDEIQGEIQFCPREANGYLGSIPEGVDPKVMNTAADVIGTALERDGFHERAAALLERHGYRAWVNCVGHVAIDPEVLPG